MSHLSHGQQLLPQVKSILMFPQQAIPLLLNRTAAPLRYQRGLEEGPLKTGPCLHADVQIARSSPIRIVIFVISQIVERHLQRNTISKLTSENMLACDRLSVPSRIVMHPSQDTRSLRDTIGCIVRNQDSSASGVIGSLTGSTITRVI